MSIEIEKKFLVHEHLLSLPPKGKKLIQGYIWSDPEKSLRIRISDTAAWLTIKSGNNPLCRNEFEYEIPLTDAKNLLNLCEAKIEKTRYLIAHKGHTWEIDVFDGENKGLLIAEIELINENEELPLPLWVDREVTNDPRYLNVELIKHPFSKW